MFNNYTPYNNCQNISFNAIITLVNAGMDILRKSNTDMPVKQEMVNLWQKYAQVTLNNINEMNNQNIVLEYNLFLLTLTELSPFEQISESIKKLLEIARKCNSTVKTNFIEKDSNY